MSVWLFARTILIRYSFQVSSIDSGAREYLHSFKWSREMKKEKIKLTCIIHVYIITRSDPLDLDIPKYIYICNVYICKRRDRI